jgi:hypothetical protein
MTQRAGERPDTSILHKGDLMRAISAFAASLIGGAILSGCSESTTPSQQPVTYTASLTAGAEIPAPTGNPTATGTATMSLSAQNVLTVSINITGNLTSDVTMAHIHGPASTTANAGIVLDFVPSMQAVISAGTRTGNILNATFDLAALPVSATGVLRVSSAELISMMNNGQAYVNVHTVTNPPGELRGQISRSN